MIAWLALPAWLLRWILRRLPQPLLARLDAWSYRKAQQRAALRRRTSAAR